MFYSNKMCYFIVKKLAEKSDFMEEKTPFNDHKLFLVR